MYVLSKYSRELLVSFGIIITYLVARLYNILSLPIFTDEAIYTRWAQIAKNDAAWRFISLTDGKQPLFIWFQMVMMGFVSDPLLAGRLVSVGAGLVTTIGLFFLTYELFKNRWLSLLASFLYLIFPFALVYDRLGLYDSLVTAFAIWSLYLELLLVRFRRLDIALILGMVLGAAVLNKSNAFLFIMLLPFSLLLFNFRQKEWKKELVRWAILAGIATVLAFGFYSILRLSPYFHIIGQKNTEFIYPFSIWIQTPFQFISGNLRAMIGWFSEYMSIPLIFLVIGSFFISKKNIGEKLLLLAWFVLPFIALAFFGKVLYPRYILPMVIVLLPLAALALYELLSRVTGTTKRFLVILIFTALLLRADYYILADFSKAPIPKSDIDQYSNAWPAGGGVKESIEFFKEESRSQKIFVGTQGTFGLMPYALEIYLLDNPNVTVEGFWPIDHEPPQKLIEKSKEIPTYVLFYQPCTSCPADATAPKEWPVELVKEYKKPDSYLRIYKFNK